ncbi:retinoschisin-like [Acropora palmata]|uniref:retinoschisin-like n=1 Tax=Acropora palmata TaxID=6131 RepID=UPI003DA066A8
MIQVRSRVKLVKGCVKLWIITCLLITLPQNANCQSSCDSVSSISGYSLVQHRYRILPKVRLITCIITCQNDPECYSLNFRFSTRQCELSNGTRLSIAPEYFVPSVDTVYFDNLYRPYKPCDMTPCKNKGSCVIINSYPGYKCDCQKGYFGPRCEECFSSQPLGMINGKIPDNQITASSHAPGFPPNKARARGNSCWRSANNTLGEYLEINFERKRFVYKVEIDKDPQADSWTEQFYLEYYTGTVWRNVSRPYGAVTIFKGNSAKIYRISHYLRPNSDFYASAVRIYPLKWHGNIALRVELYGC